MTASARAEREKADVAFVVDDSTYKTKGEAKVALAALLDRRAADMTEIQFVAGKDCFKCPMSAKAAAKKAKTDLAYRVGGIDFDTKERAKLAAERVSKAIAAIKMTYKADGKVVGCPKSCKGKKVTYVVGDEETPCQQSASLMLAERRIRTIVETAAAAL